LISVLRTAARAGTCDSDFLDALAFEHSVESHLGCDPQDVLEHPEAGGVFAGGVYLEGGRWDVHSQQIEDCRPGENFCQMPIIHFLPVHSSHSSSDAFGITTRILEEKDDSCPARPRRAGKGDVTQVLPSFDEADESRFELPSSPPSPRSARCEYRYTCPLYRIGRATDDAFTTSSTSSTNDGVNGLVPDVICAIALATAALPSRWVLRGLALACEPPSGL